MIRPLVLLALLAGTAQAGSPEWLRTVKLAMPERVAAQEALAAEARTRGDREAETAHLIEACYGTLFLAFDAKAAPCVRAEAAARALPTTYLLARLRAYQATFVAWTLDWTLAKALVDEAAKLGHGGPAAETLAGDALRVVHLIRGVVESEAGRYAEVEHELQTFIALARAAGDDVGIASGESFLCRFHWRTAQYGEASAACERGLVAARAIQDPLATSGILWNRGNVERDRGDISRAVATWEESVALAEQAKAPFVVVTVLNDLAATLIDVGRFDEAQTHFDRERAVLAAGLVPPAFGYQIDWLAGALAAGRGDARAAIESFRKAQGSPIDGVATSAFVGEAAARHQLRELAEAEAAYRAAIARVEAARSGVAKNEQRAGFMQRQVHAYQELVGVLWDRYGAGASADALAIAEAARARALLDALHAAGVRAETSKPLDARALQQRVPAGVTLVMFVATESRLFGFAVTRDRLAFVELAKAGTREQLGARIDLYRELLASADDPRELVAPGGALFADLLEPLVGSDPGPLVIAADGPLHLLPFDALVVDGRFLVERSDVVMTPSGSLLATTGAAGTHEHLLAIAAPPTVPPLAPLVASRAEVDAIRGALAAPGVLLASGEASEARFRASGPGNFGVLHFATHAVIDDRLPLRSGLLMAPGANTNDDDGWLRAAEIYRLQLHAALVVLSGCQTGAGHVSASEGPMSLARAFVHAGVRNVIATLWDLEDRHGPAMASALYRELATGASVGGALARAKRAVIAAGAPPRAWAPWVAIGPPDTTTTLAPAPPGSGTRYLAIGLAVFGVLAIAGAVVLGRR